MTARIIDPRSEVDFFPVKSRLNLGPSLRCKRARIGRGSLPATHATLSQNGAYEVTELFLMRGSPDVFCFAPFAVDRTLSGEQEAFDYDGDVFCRIADTKRLVCPADIRAIGDVVEILLSLCWSKTAATALDGIRWSPTVRMRDIEVRNSKDKVLGVFQWACDFGRYDVLDRSRSRFDVVKGTNAVLHVEHPVVVKSRIPECDVFRSIYGAELFVTAAVRCRLLDAACGGFTFRHVEFA